MATANVSYTFVNATTADATQVNQNFTDLVNFLNTSVVQKDGSITMTGALALPASDPVSSDQAARKAYVDSKAAALLDARSPATWTSWTPTWDNLAVGTGGNASNTGSYVQVGKTVFFRAKFVIGTTGQSVTGAPVLNLPVAAKAPDQLNAQAVLTDSSGTGDFFLQALIQGGTSKCQFRVLNVAGTYPVWALISASVPQGLSPGDSLTVDGYYEAS